MRVLTRFLFPFFSCKVWNLPVLEKKTQLTTVSMETVRMAKFPTQKEKINYFTNSVFQVFRLHAFFFIPTIREVGGTPRKIGLGCARYSQKNWVGVCAVCLPKPLRYLWKNLRCSLSYLWPDQKFERPGARFSKGPETYRARKATIVNLFSKTEMVCTPETSCMNRTSVRIKNMWTKPLCNH